MFRSTGVFDKLLEKATSHLLMEPDWRSTLQICDLIRQNDVQPRYALAALRKKLTSPNPHTALYALMVIESMVKNCGTIVHEELSSKSFCEFLHELAKTTPHDNVRTKLLELIQTWTFAFRKNPKHGALKDTMTLMKTEGYKFPQQRESDAMFTADSAPDWADGDVCHRCRVQFSLILRKHHCRACGQVFCAQCTSKSTTLPKYGIEKEVRVCDSCYEQATKPSTSAKTAQLKTEYDLPPEYLKSSLAQQSQEPPKKTEEELREEEELQLALALSQSEAEAKEKEKEKYKSYSSVAAHTFKPEPVVERAPTPPEEQLNPELQRYLNRSYWDSLQSEKNDTNAVASPSAPATAPVQNEIKKSKENGVVDNELEDFIKTLKSQVEIFINRMKSNSSRGRSIANDTSVQTLFMNITAMHSRLLRYIQEHDDSRIHFERLQDRLTQVKDARAALDALREEHRDKLKREAEEAERQRQLQMAHKLEIMRKKKQEYLQYQRQLALQRIQEQEREMQMRQEQQKQQYMMPQYGYIGSPVHGQQFPPPNRAPPPPSMATYNTYPYAQHIMGPMGPPQTGTLPHQQPPMAPPPGFPVHPTTTATPNNPQPQYGVPSQQMLSQGVQGMSQQSLSNQSGMVAPNQNVMLPPNQRGMMPNQGMLPPGIPQGQSIPQQGQGAPPQGQIAPMQGQMVPPQGQMALAQGQMAPPQSQMAPPQSQMVPPQGQMAPPQGQMAPPQGQMAPPQGQMVPPQGQMGHIPPHYQQAGAPPANNQSDRKTETQTGELISFD